MFALLLYFFLFSFLPYLSLHLNDSRVRYEKHHLRYLEGKYALRLDSEVQKKDSMTKIVFVRSPTATTSMNQKNKFKMSVISLVEHLPPEIKLDIFSRLPAESVLRCKCVCRSWRSILQLNERQFSRMHLHQQKKQEQHQVDFIIRVNNDKYCTKGKDFEFLQYLDDRQGQITQAKQNDEQSSKVSYQLTKVDHRLVVKAHKYSSRHNLSAKVIGSCNGLVCVAYFADPVYVCNPVTGEYLNLPHHEEYTHSFTTKLWMYPGFGYHPLTDEYKVVRVLFKDRVGHAEVYTLGKDCGRWRRKEQVSPDWLNHPSFSINGTIYWKGHTTPIVAFDLAEEEFYVPKLPPEWSRTSGFHMIGNLGGCLYLCRCLQKPSVDIWVMKNNCTRSNEEWVKEFSIPRTWTICAPCALTNNRDVLFWYNLKNIKEVYLGRYNPKTGSLKRSIREGEEEEDTMGRAMKSQGTWRFGNEVFPHVKSFISLKDDIGEEKTKRVKKETTTRVKKMMKKKKNKNKKRLKLV